MSWEKNETGGRWSVGWRWDRGACLTRKERTRVSRSAVGAGRQGDQSNRAGHAGPCVRTGGLGGGVGEEL